MGIRICPSKSSASPTQHTKPKMSLVIAWLKSELLKREKERKEFEDRNFNAEIKLENV